MSETPTPNAFKSSPLRDLQQAASAVHIPYGSDAEAYEIVESFGQWEAEYAMIRKGVGIFEPPPRGILRLTGEDRQPFINSMLTQDVGKLTGGSTTRGFHLNEKGRIIADVIVHHGDIDTWMEMDRFDVQTSYDELDKRLFTEDVTIENISEQRVALALIGPAARNLLDAVADDAAEASTPGKMIDMPGTHHVLSLAGHLCSCYRWDDCGVLGVRLLVPTEGVAALYEKLAEHVGGLVPNVDQAEGAPEGGGAKRILKGRGIGWSAYNTARIEAGSPLFHVDFGVDCLPHETGILKQTTSFTKGCYIGQEIVARMENLGHPKRILVGLRCKDGRLPIAGSQVFDAEDTTRVVGAITSSTASPMLGGAAIAFAMVKWGKHRKGTQVKLPAEGEFVDAEVGDLSSL